MSKDSTSGRLRGQSSASAEGAEARGRRGAQLGLSQTPHARILPFDKHSLSTCWVPGTGVDAGESAVTPQTNVWVLWGLPPRRGGWQGRCTLRRAPLAERVAHSPWGRPGGPATGTFALMSHTRPDTCRRAHNSSVPLTVVQEGGSGQVRFAGRRVLGRRRWGPRRGGPVRGHGAGAGGRVEEPQGGGWGRRCTSRSFPGPAWRKWCPPGLARSQPFRLPS